MTIPRPEYPRPQFVRPDWLCLNGEWQFELDGGDSGLARGLVHVYLCLEQQRLNGLVGLQQRALGLAQQLAAQIVQLAVNQPGRPIGQRVDAAHRCGKHARQQPFAERRAQAGGRVLGDGGAALVHYRPALGGELL